MSGRQARRQRSARVMSAKTAAEKDDPVPDDDFYECVREDASSTQDFEYDLELAFSLPIFSLFICPCP